MRRLLYGLGALVGLALAAAVVAPYFVDWERFKPVIADEVKRRTGRELAIHGRLELSVLPLPTLRAADLRLANLAGASNPEMARIAFLDIRVALLPLFAGRIEAEEISLVDPVIRLEVLADGRRNWDFAAAPGPAPAAEPAQAPAAGGMTVRIDRVRIEGGTVIYRDSAADYVEIFKNMHATVLPRARGGAARAKGAFLVRGLLLSFDASLGPERGGAPAPLTLALRYAEADARARFTGTAAWGPEGLRLSGKAHADGGDLGGLARAVGAGPMGARLAGDFTLDGEVETRGREIAVNDVSFETRDLRGTGAGSFRLGAPLKADLALALGRLDLDRLLAPAVADQPTGAAAGALSRRGAPVAPWPTLPAGLALPADAEVSLDLAADSVVYRHDVVRKLRLAAELRDGAITLREASVQLPGASELWFSGRVSASRDGPRVAGKVRAAAGNLRSLLAWFGADVSSVPQGRLRRMASSARLTVTPGRVRLSELALELDVSRIAGTVEVALAERPAITADLEIDRLDWDAYMPRRRDGEPPPAADGASGEPAEGARTGARPPPLPFDAEVRARIGRLDAGGAVIREARIDGAIAGPLVTLREARAEDMAGARVVVKGVIFDPWRAPRVDLGVMLETDDAGEVLRRAAGIAGPAASRLGAASVSGRLAGGREGLTLGLEIELAGGTIQVSGTARRAGDEPEFDLEVTASHADLARLARVLDPGAPADGDGARFDLAAKVSGRGGALRVSNLEAGIGQVRVRGSAAIDVSGPRPRLDAELTTGEIGVEHLLALPLLLVAGRGTERIADGGGEGEARWSRAPLDLSALAAVDARIVLAAEALAWGARRIAAPRIEARLGAAGIEGLKLGGTLFGGGFTLEARLAGARTLEAQATIELKGGNIEKALEAAELASLAGGALDMRVELAARGASVRELVASLSGAGEVSVRDGAIRGFDLAAVNARVAERKGGVGLVELLAGGMSGGGTRFARLAGRFRVDEGIVRSEDLTLEAEGGGATAVVLVDLIQWLVDVTAEFRFAAAARAPPLRVFVNGPLDRPRRIIDFKALQAHLLAGAGDRRK